MYVVAPRLYTTHRMCTLCLIPCVPVQTRLPIQAFFSWVFFGGGCTQAGEQWGETPMQCLKHFHDLLPTAYQTVVSTCQSESYMTFFFWGFSWHPSWQALNMKAVAVERYMKVECSGWGYMKVECHGWGYMKVECRGWGYRKVECSG